MVLKIRLLFLFVFCVLLASASSENKDCEISFIVKNEKKEYKYKDTITVMVKVELDAEFCDEAGDITKIYSKGLKIENRSEWKKLSKTSVGQILELTVLKDKTKATVTALRKTGHYNCFQQKQFIIGEE